MSDRAKWNCSREFITKNEAIIMPVGAFRKTPQAQSPIMLVGAFRKTPTTQSPIMTNKPSKKNSPNSQQIPPILIKSRQNSSPIGFWQYPCKNFAL